jgi:hypothetical protein
VSRYQVQRMFAGRRDEARLVSRHRSLDAAVHVALAWRAGDGWGARVVDETGAEIDLWPEARRLGLA